METAVGCTGCHVLEGQHPEDPGQGELDHVSSGDVGPHDGLQRLGSDLVKVPEIEKESILNSTYGGFCCYETSHLLTNNAESVSIVYQIALKTVSQNMSMKNDSVMLICYSLQM